MRLAIYMQRVRFEAVFFLPEHQEDILTEEAALRLGSDWADGHPTDIVMLVKEE